MKVSFVLIGEGTSDLRMLTHIENILIEEGFDEVSGKPLLQEYGSHPIGRTVTEKLIEARKQFPSADLFIVHRDADNAGSQARLDEILNATAGLDLSNLSVIPMVPVKALEAWLLACPKLINRIAGNRDENAVIACLPSLRSLEAKASPKDLLLSALCEASGTQGGRLAAFKKRFYEMRARLTEDLEIDGPQNSLPSYAFFRLKLREFSVRAMAVQSA